MEFLTSRFPQLEKLSLSNLSDELGRLAPRERNLALAALAFVLIFILFMVIRSGSDKLSRLQTQVSSSEKSLQQVKRLAADLEEKNRQTNQLFGRIRKSGGFYLSSYLEAQATRFRVQADSVGTESRQDIGDNLEEVSTDVKINGISFPRMLNLLSEIENSPETLLRLKRIRLKIVPNDPNNVELHFRVSAYVQKS